MIQLTKTVDEIAVEVYKRRLNDKSGGGKGAVARMLAEDNDDGKKLRGRARAYIPTIRVVLAVIGAKAASDG